MVGERADGAADPLRIRKVRHGATAHADRISRAERRYGRARDDQRLTERADDHAGGRGGAGVPILRSVAFNILFYLNLVLHVVAAIPTYALPRRAFMAVAKSWGRTSNALLAVAGIRVELRGVEKIPPGALLVAAKHQSVWETFTLLTLFDDP